MLEGEDKVVYEIFAFDSDCPWCGTKQRDYGEVYKKRMKVRCDHCGVEFFAKIIPRGQRQ
jgi:uncharacterized Zn finger protein